VVVVEGVKERVEIRNKNSLVRFFSFARSFRERTSDIDGPTESPK